TAVKSVDERADAIARLEVRRFRRPNLITGKRRVDGRALHARNRLSGLKSQRAVQGEGASMVRSLEQSHARVRLLANALESGFHQATTNSTVLRIGIHSNRPESGDRRALVEEVTAHDFAIKQRNNAEEMRMREQHLHETTRVLHRRKVGREIVAGGKAAKGRVADSAACLCIRRAARTEDDSHWGR